MTFTLLTTGCLSGSHAYLKLSTDYALPREYVDPRGYGAIVDSWTRDADLGLDCGFVATLEDPAVGAEIVSRDFQQSRAAGPPGADALATWQILYGTGDRLPIRVRWRFDQHLYDPSVRDPGSGWTFTLKDDRDYTYSPLYRGRLTIVPDPADWVGTFTLWFRRQSLDGKLCFTPHTRELTLHIAGKPGSADVSWRFLPLLDRAEYGLYDQLDSAGALGQRQPLPTPAPVAEPTPEPSSRPTDSPS